MASDKLHTLLPETAGESVYEKRRPEKGRKLREVLSSLKLGESVILHDFWANVKNEAAKPT